MEDRNFDRPDSNIDRETRGIGWAVKQLLNGSKVTRRNWNGKGQFLFLVHGVALGDTSNMSLPFVAINTVKDETVPWLCSQTDLLSTDWELFIFNAPSI